MKVAWRRRRIRRSPYKARGGALGATGPSSQEGRRDGTKTTPQPCKNEVFEHGADSFALFEIRRGGRSYGRMEASGRTGGNAREPGSLEPPIDQHTEAASRFENGRSAACAHVARERGSIRSIQGELVKVNRDRLSQSVAAQLSEFTGRMKPKSASSAARPSYTRTAPRKRPRSSRLYEGSHGCQRRRTTARFPPPQPRGRYEKRYPSPRKGFKEEATEATKWPSISFVANSNVS